MRAAVALVVALALGCSVLRPYPPSSEERGPTACHNSFDDDLDGLLDCADPDCARECPEESIVACSNGRDDDGDGLEDGRDPRCWPVATLSVNTGCVEIDGAEVRWPGADLATSEGVEERAAEIAFLVGEAGFVYGTELVTGDLAGMTIEMEIDVAPDRRFEVGVMIDGREGALAAGAPDSVGVTLEGDSITQLHATIGANRYRLDAVPAIRAMTALRVLMHIAPVADGFELDRVGVYIESAPELPLMPHIGLPTYWTAETPVRIYARAEAGELEVRLRSIHVLRPTFSGPCVRTEDRLRRVLAAVDTGEVICALVAAGPGPDSTASELEIRSSIDCGANFRPVHRIAMSDLAPLLPGAPLALASAAALALGAGGDQVDLAIGLPNQLRLTANSLHDVVLGTLSTHDCSLLLPLEGSGLVLPARDAVASPVPTFLARGPRASALGLGGGRAPGATRLWLVESVTRYVSSCDRGLGIWDCEALVRTLPGGDALDNLLGLGVFEHGGDVVVTGVRPTGGLAALITRVDGPALTADLSAVARTPGTFNENGIGFPTLMPFHPDTACAGDGLLFLGGLPRDPRSVPQLHTEALPYRFTLPAAI